MNNEQKQRWEPLQFLFTWLLHSTLAAVSGVIIVHGFSFLLLQLQQLLKIFVFLPLWAGFGALIVGSIIYRLSPGSAGEGIPSYVNGMNNNNGELSFSSSFFKFLASLGTLGFYGAGGIIGPMGRTNAGILSSVTGLIFKQGKHRRTAGIAGFAAVTGLIFNAPLGGGIFAVEILKSASIPYVYLFPAILASSLAVFISRALQLPRFIPLVPQDWAADPLNLPIVVIVAFVAGLAGKGFNQLYRFTAYLIKREHIEKLWLKIIIGAITGCLLIWAVNPSLTSTGTRGLTAVFMETGNLYGRLPQTLPLFLICLIMIVIRSTGTCLTIGSGLSAGITSSVVMAGLLIGCSAASLAGIHLYSGDYYALLAAGFAGMLGSSMNVPIAAAVLGVEIFGLEYSLPAAVAAIIGYQVNRYNSVYDYFQQGE